ncbi:MAG: polysaccharide deacetylase family protein [archaeon]|nr:polysaccharide deacetylase family protein [archaeon]
MKRKEIYLTIDDAPSKDFEEKREFLRKNKIPAIFFCRGSYAENRKEQLISAIKEGFLIGNHSYNHPHFSSIDLKQAGKEIEKTDRLIEELYALAKIKRKYKLFRFPYGDKGGKIKDEIQNILKAKDYEQPDFKVKLSWMKEHDSNKDVDVLWTLDYQEWNSKTSIEDINKKMSDKNPEKGGNLYDLNFPEVFLIHDHNGTKEKFFFILNKLIEMNIKFVSLN